MVVGVLRISLVLPGVHSLKEKRRILVKLRDRVRARFNVSWAEVDDQDLHQRATVGVAAVSSDARYVDGQLARVAALVEGAELGFVADSDVELIHL